MFYYFICAIIKILLRFECLSFMDHEHFFFFFLQQYRKGIFRSLAYSFFSFIKFWIKKSVFTSSVFIDCMTINIKFINSSSYGDQLCWGKTRKTYFYFLEGNRFGVAGMAPTQVTMIDQFLLRFPWNFQSSRSCITLCN